MSVKKDTEQYLAQLKREGYKVEDTRGGHTRITHPEMDGMVHSSGTPSDHRSLKNLKSEVSKRMRAGRAKGINRNKE